MIDLDYAEEIGLFNLDMEHRTAKARGMGGEEMIVYLIEVERFEVANRVVHNIQIGFMDFKNLKAGDAMSQSKGIVGYQFLKDYQLILDYPKKTLELRDSGSEITHPVHDLEYMAHHLVKIPVKVGDQLLTMVLDSGAGGFVLNKPSVDKIGWQYRLSEEKGRGIGGEVSTWEMEISGFEVLDEKYPGLTARIMDMGEFYQDGIIGFSLLQYARLIIDYPRKKISLTKSS